MRSIVNRRAHTRRLAVLLAVGALVVAAPVSGAGAAVSPFSFFGGAGIPAGYAGIPVAYAGVPGGYASGVLTTSAGVMNGGPNTGITNAGCGQNRPAVLGGTGGTESVACGALLAFIGPSIGQINSQVGPTIIGSVVLAPVTVSAGNVVNLVP